MLTAMPAELLDYGLFSGLHAQSEISKLLDELYYAVLATNPATYSETYRDGNGACRRRRKALQSTVRRGIQEWR